MPAKWFRCPDGGKVEIAACLREGGCRMAGRCAPPAYLKMVAYERTRKWKCPNCGLSGLGNLLEQKNDKAGKRG